MPLFKKLSDSEQIKKWDNEDKQMLIKNYDLLSNQKEFPLKAYLLKPNKLFAVSYEKLNDNIHLNIRYTNSFSSYITDTVRVNYNRIYIGTLIFSDIKSFEEVPFTPVSYIKHSLFSKYKEVSIPIQKKMSLLVNCKRIYINSFDIYVLHDEKIILEEDYREILKGLIEKGKQ